MISKKNVLATDREFEQLLYKYASQNFENFLDISDLPDTNNE